MTRRPAARRPRGNRRPRAKLGEGANQFTDAAKTLPTAYNLATQAIGDADQWWTEQGSAPPPLQFEVAQPADGVHNGLGWYHSGQMQVSPSYLNNLNTVLNGKGSRRGKAQALVGLWRLMAHERGHNIGYDHSPGGIMDADWAPPPGRADEWAASVLSTLSSPRGARRPRKR